MVGFLLRAVLACLAGGILAEAAPLCQFAREERLLTQEQFEDLYFQKEPVLLVGAAAEWAASRWDRASILERISNIPSVVEDPLMPESSGVYTPVAEKIDLEPFVQGMHKMHPHELLFSTEHSPLMKALHGDLDPNTLPVGVVRRSPSFSLGAKRMGTTFHKHDHSWLAQLHGRKLWFLHDGDLEEADIMDKSLKFDTEDVDNVTYDIDQFDSCSYHKHPPEHAVNFRRCVASPGDIMYVPITWEHATCSLDDWTLGIGWHGDASDTPMASLAVLDNDEASLRAALTMQEFGLEADPDYPKNPALQGAEVAETSAHLAAFKGHVRMLTVLEELGVDFHQNNHGMGAPLHTAAGWGHVPVAEWLVKRGMHPDVRQTGSLATPLHYAAAVGHMPLVRWLLDHSGTHESLDGKAGGADRRLKDQRGRTALHYAAGNGHKDVVELLIHGRMGGRHLRDLEGMTAQELAIQRGHSTVARRLQTVGTADLDSAAEL